ncbi:MAG: STAS domain-containing protein [Desulfovibrio sp.]|jgi:anti-anti-sigma regulatory factor|nr:STAS domain-containing protein [Desulfovibrio sp.]
MKEFVDSPFLGEFARALTADLGAASGGEFPCRPVMARTVENSTVLGRFTGAIGLPQIREFREALFSLIMENMEKVILDFETASLTPTAVGVLMAFASSIRGNDKRMYLYRASRQIRDLLRELELTPFLYFLETEDDVLTALAV